MDSNDLRWGFPPLNFSLESDQVHVWRAALDIPTTWLKRLERTLSVDECERAERFHFKRDRDHFMAARGCLRNILGLYLGTAPDRLQFHYSPYGKPYLVNELNKEEIRFNVSHAHGLGLIAVTKCQEIGVDIEYMRDDLADEQIARRFFSASEVNTLLALPKSQRKKAFFTCWTRKEAYIKGKGEGLSLPLDQFDVSLIPGEAAALLSTRPDPQEAARWTLSGLAPGSGYVAAVAVQARKLQLICWQWPGWKD